MKLQSVVCYNCNSDGHDFYAEENGFTLVRCRGCGLLYINPRPTDEGIKFDVMAGLHHGERNFRMAGSFSNGLVQKYIGILNDIYGNELRRRDKIKWLDIGSGNGEFLRALHLWKGFSADLIQGLEPNKAKREFARSENLNIVAAESDLDEKQFDLISLLNVYSHLPNPIEALMRWRKLLKSDGELFLETGDSAHLPSQDHHKPFYLPDHLSFASEKIVLEILNKVGFKVISVKKYRHPSFPEPNTRTVARAAIGWVREGGKPFANLFPKYPDRDMWIRARRLC